MHEDQVNYYCIEFFVQINIEYPINQKEKETKNELTEMLAFISQRRYKTRCDVFNLHFYFIYNIIGILR